MRAELPGKPRHLVWLQTGFLGDQIITTAAFGAAAEYLPGIRQHLITSPVGAAALDGQPHLQSVVAFRKRAGSFRRSAREVKHQLREAGVYDEPAVLLRPHRSTRSGLLTLFLGLPSVTYRQSHMRFRSVAVERVAVLHEENRIALLLEPLGIPREKIMAVRQNLSPLPPSDAPWSSQLDGAKLLVALAPGSVWGTKRWPVEGWQELATRLLDNEEVTLVLLGSSEEQAASDEIAAYCNAGSRLVNLAGRTSLDDLRRIYPRLRLLVSNDSSPIHYASAFNIPTVALFGATIPAMGFGPRAAGSTVLGTDIDCRPCSGSSRRADSMATRTAFLRVMLTWCEEPPQLEAYAGGSVSRYRRTQAGFRAD